MTFASQLVVAAAIHEKMSVVSSLGVLPEREADARPVDSAPSFDFEEVYQQYFAFVWRSLRRLGVHDIALDDAAQDVFVVVHRRQASLEGRASLRSWLFGIAMRVAADYRRAARRKRRVDVGERNTEAVADMVSPSPLESVERAEAARLLHAILNDLDDDKRALIIMAELEQMNVREIAQVLEANTNTVYSRLRTARADVERAAARHRARDGWRQR